MRLKALDKLNLDVEHARNEKRRKEGQEKSRLDVAVDDVSIAIIEQLTDARRDIDLEKSALKSYVAERLTSDDQILSRLPNMVSTIVSETEISEDEKSVDQWCKAIVSFRTAEIKARVDAVYLESLSKEASHTTTNESDTELQVRKEALQAELEELHAEVASIAEMVVEHELRKPMVDVKERREKERSLARTAWLNYVCPLVSPQDNLILILSGALNARLHGQASEHGQCIVHGSRRVPASHCTDRRRGFKTHAECPCPTTDASQETNLVCATFSVHADDEAQTNGIT